MNLSRTLVAFSVLMIVGCGDSKRQIPGRVKTYPVIGKVLVDGGPAVSPTRIQIKVSADDNTTGMTAGTFADADGSFAISTYESGDGLAPGTYELTFHIGRMDLMSMTFEGVRYVDPNSPGYTVTVTKTQTDPIDLGTINLTIPSDTSEESQPPDVPEINGIPQSPVETQQP